MNSDYNAQNITVLKGLEAVRKRPGMYVGTTGIDGLHHLVFEVVDNSVDEAMQGFCDNILVVLEGNDIVRVEDNGRGIPVDIHHGEGVSALELVMTLESVLDLHADKPSKRAAIKTTEKPIRTFILISPPIKNTVSLS